MRFWFLIKEGLLGLRRARFASLIALLSIALSLFLFGLFLSVAVNLSRTFGQMFRQVQLEVFVDPSLDAQALAQLRGQLAAHPAIARVDLITPEQALKEFQENFGQDLIRVLDENPLPPHFRVQVQEKYSRVEQLDQIVADLKKLPHVDDVLFQRELLRLINKYFYTGLIVAGLLGLIVFVITTLLIFNTIRLTIYARQQVIEIMRLIGASNALVKGPFIVEGIIQGVLGAVLAVGLLELVKHLFQSVFSTALYLPHPVWYALLATGALLGIVGATISVNKYLPF
ncbi:MAG: ABC transporter permease [Calditrichaeota bacterium]|nr:MAG: ABC transporter permease [Calditrichota bacterium]